MSYLPPHVSVTQILTRASQNLVNSELLPTYVGSLNQVVKKAPVALAFPFINPTTISFLGLKPGAIIDTASVKLTVDNAVVEITTNAAVGVFTVGSKTVTDTGAFVATKAGDKIVLPNAGGTYTIASVTSNDSIELTSAASYAPGTGNYSIQRLASTSVDADYGTATFSSTSFSITQLKYSGFDIIGGDVSLSYVALRKDLLGYYTVTNFDQLTADMDIDPESNIGFYLGQIALAANGGTTVLAYITTDNTLASFNEAYSELAIRKDVYFVVPISTDATICGGAASHAQAMANPDISYFRMAMVNTPITLKNTLVSNESFTKV